MFVKIKANEDTFNSNCISSILLFLRTLTCVVNLRMVYFRLVRSIFEFCSENGILLSSGGSWIFSMRRQKIKTGNKFTRIL